VPLERSPAQFAVESILPAPYWTRALAREMFRYAGARRFLSTFWESTAMSFRRPGARPLFEWLFDHNYERFLSGTAIIRRSWRGSNGTSILYCFSESDSLPSAIVKTTLVGNTSASPEREAEALRRLVLAREAQAPRFPKFYPSSETIGIHRCFYLSSRGDLFLICWIQTRICSIRS
jgi:hypothetical protein